MSLPHLSMKVAIMDLKVTDTASFARFWTKNGTYNNLGGIINVN